MGLKFKNIRLRTFFVQYLLALFAGFICILLTCVALMFAALKAGFIISVGEVETSIENQKPVIISAKEVSPQLIPETCKYAVIDKNGKFLSGDIDQREACKAWRIIKSGGRILGGFQFLGINMKCLYPIERENEVCIIEYSSKSQFSSKLLRDHLISPDTICLSVFFIAFIAEIILLAAFYGKRIGRKLLPLQNATEKIREKDLAFDIKYSGIEEVDSALHSLDSMKSELKQSLETQWKMEQTKKTQFSALAHDLKTPLTVIRGNAEILSDTNQTEDQKECTDYILKNAGQMEQYIQMLIDMSKMESGYPLKFQTLSTRSFLDSLYTQIKSLASVKKICVETEEKNIPETLHFDIALMTRAIINIASNAVEYSPEQGIIRISVNDFEHTFNLAIEDSGSGFSQQDIRNATKQFYQGDFSRSSKYHYGMGLFIADSIIKKHGGVLTIGNAPSTGGGLVTIKIQLKN